MSTIRLRDVTLADADLLDSWANDAARSEFNDFGEPREPTPREALARGPLRDEHNGLLIVELSDGTPIGTVGWHRVRYGPSPTSDAWNIGIEVRSEHRGRGYGSQAQLELARYLFDTTGVNRVEASTDVDNRAEQRALEKAGFVREGIQRGAQWRAGSFHDLVTYALVRSDLA